ncbi:MAG: hypothetical protein JW852_11620 [Spirochaetales bacterium]|nr:hypothetical protein [Spirochaetales bacterium]
MQPRAILWLVIAVGRVSAFIFTAILLLTGLFFLGNLQEFTDSTQILLLKLIDVFSEVFLLSVICYVLLIIFEAIRLKRILYVRLIVALSGFLIVAVMFVFSNFLNSWL